MSSPTLTAAASVPFSQRWRSGLRVLADDLRLDAGLIAIFAASRFLIVVAAVVAETLIPRNPGLNPGADGPIIRSLTSWDGWYYLGIVSGGYQADPVAGAYSNVAFPPLYPALVKVLSLPFPAFAGVVAVVVSNVAFLLALALLVRLGTPYIGRRRATLAAGLLVIYPFASAFAMAYTESLFLLLMVASFLAVERGHRAWAGVFFALTVLCRLQGLALILPLAILMLRQDGWRPKASLGWLLLGPLAAAVFLAYIATVTGSSTAFLDAQQAWGREGPWAAPRPARPSVRRSVRTSAPSLSRCSRQSSCWSSCAPTGSRSSTPSCRSSSSRRNCRVDPSRPSAGSRWPPSRLCGSSRTVARSWHAGPGR